MLRFDGRVALVTGAGRGMGRAHALLLAARGAKVVINDLGVDMGGAGETGAPADDVVAEICAAGGSAVADRSDVATEAGAEAMVRAAVNSFGRIDIVVHNAGIVTFIPFSEMSYADYRKLVAVHQDGGFLVAKAAWPHMLRQAYGRLIFITSNATMPTLSHYASAKSALTGFVRPLGAEGATHNIRANALSVIAYTRMMSGYFDPDSGHADMGLHGQREIEDWWRDNLRPDQVAAVVGWLAHESCDITGETLMTGGGHVARQFIGAAEGYANAELSPELVAAQRGLIIGSEADLGASGPAGLARWMDQIVAGGAPPLPPLRLVTPR